MERSRIRAAEAAADERAGKMETEIKRLLKKIGKFPALADRYQKEVEALSEDSRSARGEERRGRMEPQASETMDMELAAYQSVEEAAREFQGRCQEMKDQLEAEAVRLEKFQSFWRKEEMRSMRKMGKKMRRGRTGIRSRSLWIWSRYRKQQCRSLWTRKNPALWTGWRRC